MMMMPLSKKLLQSLRPSSTKVTNCCHPVLFQHGKLDHKDNQSLHMAGFAFNINRLQPFFRNERMKIMKLQ